MATEQDTATETDMDTLLHDVREDLEYAEYAARGVRDDVETLNDVAYDAEYAIDGARDYLDEAEELINDIRFGGMATGLSDIGDNLDEFTNMAENVLPDTLDRIEEMSGPSGETIVSEFFTDDTDEGAVYKLTLERVSE